jgi:hypothetical protein
MKKLFLLPLLATLYLMTGCGGHDSESNAKAKAISCVLQECKRNGGTGNFDAKASRAGTNWSVLVTSLPRVPGGFTLFTVTESGKIIDVVGGD